MGTLQTVVHKLCMYVVLKFNALLTANLDKHIHNHYGYVCEYLYEVNLINIDQN